MALMSPSILPPGPMQHGWVLDHPGATDADGRSWVQDRQAKNASLKQRQIMKEHVQPPSVGDSALRDILLLCVFDLPGLGSQREGFEP